MAALASAVLLVGGCTGGEGSVLTAVNSTPPAGNSAPAPSTVPSVPSSASAVSAVSASSAASASSESSTSPVPVTPEGMITGPGVDDTSITLGTLVDPSLDRGFTQGFDLWRTSVNAAGGECGRTVKVVSAGHDGVPSGLPEAYLDTARETLGYVTLAGASDAAALARYAGGDGVPALTTSGTSAQLAEPGPVVIGPTDDIMAINAFGYLSSAKLLGDGPLGVVSNGSAAAEDALTGLRWAADQAKVSLDVRKAGEDSSSWGTTGAIFSLTSPADTVALLASTPATTTVMTGLDGFDPNLLAAEPAAAAAVATKRLLVVTATPAYGSDHPASVAVAGAFAAGGGVDPGPRLLEGYAAGAMWGRLLDAACTALTLTRSGVMTAMATIGPAPIDSVLGPSDPGQVVNAHQPATRLSAIAAADPSAPTGLAPVTWLEAAANIGDYHPPG